jgi:hypothetical protein
MPLLAPADQASVNRRRGSAADGVTFWHTLYIGTSRYNMAEGEADPPREALFPMAFLVEQDPGSTARAHYHQQDQFQLVLRGQGTVGLHDAAPVTVHFTGAYTAYGPIKADPVEGIWYWTLRNGFDPGAQFMERAENRAFLRQVPGRRHREQVAGPMPEAASTTLIEPESDGMGAWRHHIAPGGVLTGPDPATGRGQYWAVIAGELRHDGKVLPPRSLAFVKPDELALRAEAGPDGLDVVVMQFPRHFPSR